MLQYVLEFPVLSHLQAISTLETVDGKGRKKTFHFVLNSKSNNNANNPPRYNSNCNVVCFCLSGKQNFFFLGDYCNYVCLVLCVS